VQCLQKFRICGRVGGTKVVDWIDDSLPEELEPDAIGLSGSKAGIIGPAKPFSELSQAVLLWVRNGGS
jgi:hypothetical protein